LGTLIQLLYLLCCLSFQIQYPLFHCHSFLWELRENSTQSNQP
jgi:hypothetical protein